MTSKGFAYSLGHMSAAVLMVLALLWLTVSTPFVYAAQQDAIALKKSSTEQSDSTQNPLSSTTEEKTEIGFSSLSEYLHDIMQPEQHMEVMVKYEKCHSSGLYHAYHPDLLCPPPDSPAC